MRRRRATWPGVPLAALLPCLPLAACGDKGGDSAGVPPDVSGRYNVQLTSISGCDSDVGLVQPWAQGPLAVSGRGGDLRFDFGDDAVFSGTVDAAGAYAFGGDLSWRGAVLDVQQDGDFVEVDGGWEMRGTFRIRVDDDAYETNNCTLEAGMVATWLAAAR